MKKTPKTVKQGDKVYVIIDQYLDSIRLPMVRIEEEEIVSREHIGSNNFVAKVRKYGSWFTNNFYTGFTTEREAKQEAIRQLEQYKQHVDKGINKLIKQLNR